MNKRIIHSVFEDVAARLPGKIALTEGDKKQTYSELNTCANQLANTLRDLGLGREDIAYAFMHPGINLIICLLGIFKAGGIYMPLDIAFSKKSLKQTLIDTTADFCLVDIAWEPHVKKLITDFNLQLKYIIILDKDHSFSVFLNDNGKLHSLPGYNNSNALTSNPELVNDPQDGNYIFYTSGSTGGGKAILGCHDSLSHFIHWELKEFAVDQGFRVSQLSQHTFDASLRDIFVPLCSGGILCIPPRETKDNLSLLIQWIHDQQLTLIHTVPSLLRAIVNEIENHEGLASVLQLHLKFIILAGEPITIQDVRNWQRILGENAEIVNMYGATEATMAKTFNRIKTPLAVSGELSIHAGKPLDNTLIAIINDGELCGLGEIGEIYIVTPFLTKGYFKDPVRTSQVFVQNPLVHDRTDIVFKTGDYGRYLEGYNLQVLGRIDEQVKVNGIRVDLNEIKGAVLDFKGIKETEIITHRDNNDQHALICYFTGDVNTDALKTYLDVELNRSVIPSYYIHLDKFALTINGKTDKKALPKPEDVLTRNIEYKAPINPLEQSLENMCGKILGLTKISRHVSFFKIGGTSLKAIQYLSEIYKEFGVSINLRDIFENDTIAQMGEFLNLHKKESYQQIPAIPKANHYELSHAQKRLWIIDQFEEEQINYNMSYVSEIEGALNIKVLEKALSTIVHRHESLRSSFVMIDGLPQMVVHDTHSFSINYINISNYENKDKLSEELVNEEFDLPFDLQRESLFRITLIQVSTEKYVFILSMHHIISDGWSFEIIMKELAILYREYLAGNDHSLDPLRIHYKDFAAWQNQQLQGGKLVDLERYWVEQLSGELKEIEVPADFPKTNLIVRNGNYIEFEIDTYLTGQLGKIAESQVASVFMVLMSAVNILLNKYTGQQDIIIGTPSATRNHPDLENQVGLYINVVPIRTILQSGNESFKEILLKVKQCLLDALVHDLYPYDMLVEKILPESYKSQFPLINILVQSQQILDEPVPGFTGLHIRECIARSSTSKVDMTFNFKQTGDCIKAAIEYNSGMYKRSTIQQIIENILHIVKTVANNEDVTLSQIKLLSSEKEISELENFKQTMLNLK